MEKEIIMASYNNEKIKEAQEILKEYKIIPVKELGVEIDIEETNEISARKKALKMLKNKI